MPTDVAIRLGQRVEACEFRLDRETDLAQRLADVDLEVAEKVHAIDMKAAGEKEKRLEEALEQAGPAFWESPIIVVPLTVILTYAILKGAKGLP